MSELTLVQNNFTLILFTLLLTIVFIITPLNLGKTVSSISKLGIMALLGLVLYNNYMIYLNNKKTKNTNLTEITLDCILSFSVVILILMICSIMF